MAKHVTYKSTVQGKRRTLTYRQARATKRACVPFDIDKLTRELVNAR